MEFMNRHAALTDYSISIGGSRRKKAKNLDFPRITREIKRRGRRLRFYEKLKLYVPAAAREILHEPINLI
jgi:hypothetical protein